MNAKTGTNKTNATDNAHAAAIDALAVQLWLAAQSGVPISPVRGAIEQLEAAGAGTGLSIAYEIQQNVNQRRIEGGARLVGRKIGLTSKAVQKQLGVDAPDFGALFDDMSVCDGEEIAASRLMQPKIEAEIAMVLERDLPHHKHTVADIISATAYALPALEIVGSRIANWDIRLTDTVADNASSSLFVLGSRPVHLHKLDLIHCGMVMELRGDQVSVGAGAACLGNPLHAAVWLANTLAAMGTPLHAGDILLTGALGPMVAVQSGDVYTARIEGLGTVSAAFLKYLHAETRCLNKTKPLSPS